MELRAAMEEGAALLKPGERDMLDKQMGWLEQAAMTTLALITAGATAFEWWNWRGAIAATGESTTTFVTLSMERSRRLLRRYLPTLYGWLAGTVSYLSPDTLTEDLKQGEQAYYRMLVRAEGKQLGGQTGQSIMLQPGMTVSVEVKTGKNTVLRYLAKPIVKTVREAMVEK